MKKAIFFTIAMLTVIGLTAQQTHHIDWFMTVTSAQASLTIDVGDTVEWTFTDAAPHTVTNDAGSTETFDSGILSTGIGTTYSHTFTQVGINPYHCNVHLGMTGTITVQGAPPPCSDPSNLNATNITNNSADISWTAGGSETEWEIEYGISGFTQGSGAILNVTSTTISLVGLMSCTAYDVYVRAVCGTETSNWVGPQTLNTLVVEPSGLVCNINTTSTTTGVSWIENGSATEWEIKYGLLGFDPVTGGNSISDNDGVPDLILTGLTPNTQYDVYVRSICATGADDLWVGPCSFTTGTAGINDPNFMGFEFYPNPVKDQLHLKANNEIQKIVVFDLLGRKMMTVLPNSVSSYLNISNLEAGNYLMKVEINTSVAMFKIIKN